jgi:NADH dehydrogenase [ubiquinone] 1 alpha subcomplex assembly factor 7
MIALGSDGPLVFALSPVPAPESLVPPDRRDAPEGGVYEVSASAISLMDDIARAVARSEGAALIVDYGYDSPGFAETLQAVSGHAFADILDAPGERDLSAHVDFAALAAAARDAGAAVFGPLGQGAFLESLGIVRRTERLIASNRRPDLSLWSDLDRLIGPGQMGTLFKALAILPAGSAAPPGF